MKNSTVKLSGLNIFREYGENLKLNPVLVLVFILKSKALYYIQLINEQILLCFVFFFKERGR